jgi:hypothetical protein
MLSLSAKLAWAEVWHLWTVIIPRRLPGVAPEWMMVPSSQPSGVSTISTVATDRQPGCSRIRSAAMLASITLVTFIALRLRKWSRE